MARAGHVFASRFEQITGTAGKPRAGDIVVLDGGRLGVLRDRRGGVWDVELVNGTKKALDKAMRAYTAFRGMAPDAIEVAPAPPELGVLFSMGTVLDIAYETVRDGKRMRYRHEFSARARPQLLVSSNGSQMVIYGNGFRVTERGITDY